jgi:hypothetical protein
MDDRIDHQRNRKTWRDGQRFPLTMSGDPHSLKSSLIPVFARVWASTVFTITAQ